MQDSRSGAAVSTNDAITVALVEDNVVYSNLLREILAKCGRVNLVAAYSSIGDACAEIPKLEPKVVLVDLGLPDGNGIRVIEHLRRTNCRSECVVLTVYDDDRHLFTALTAGATGYVLKDQIDLTTVPAAIEETMNGGAPMSSSIARRVLRYFPRQGGEKASSPALTARENEIIGKLAQGHSARKVAELMHISYQTVRCHQRNIYKKLQVGSVLQALAALDHSIVPKRTPPTPILATGI